MLEGEGVDALEAGQVESEGGEGKCEQDGDRKPGEAEYAGEREDAEAEGSEGEHEADADESAHLRSLPAGDLAGV